MQKSVAIFLSFLLLASTSGITYAQHFCGGHKMMDVVTIGHKELSCGMVAMDTCNDQKNDEDEHDCCSNEYTKITTDDNFSPSQDTLLIAPFFVAAFISNFMLPSRFGEAKKTIYYSAYHAPPLIKDIPVLYETFLI